jgi:hypothetical protein
VTVYVPAAAYEKAGPCVAPADAGEALGMLQESGGVERRAP